MLLPQASCPPQLLVLPSRLFNSLQQCCMVATSKASHGDMACQVRKASDVPL